MSVIVPLQAYMPHDEATRSKEEQYHPGAAVNLDEFLGGVSPRVLALYFAPSLRVRDRSVYWKCRRADGLLLFDMPTLMVSSLLGQAMLSCQLSMTLVNSRSRDSSGCNACSRCPSFLPGGKNWLIWG